MSRRRTTVVAGVKLVAFVAVAAAVTLTVAGTIRPLGGGDERVFHAVFASASDLRPGDQVRVAGVVAGRVTDVELDEDARARVSFRVDGDLQPTTATRAQVRYLNLIGNRYLALSEGAPAAAAEPLPDGGTIPLERTEPALDLDELFTGFKPLFAALSPDDANALAEDIVATFQGEAGTVGSLLQHTAEVTGHLADRDAVIGRVVENLTGVLAVVDRRQDGLDDLITQLARYVGGLAADRDVLGASIEGIEDLTTETAGLLQEIRPGLRVDVDRLAALVAVLDRPDSRALIEEAIVDTPRKLARLSRISSYGSWFNFYLCDVGVDVQGGGSNPLAQLLGQIDRLTIHDTSPRCRS